MKKIIERIVFELEKIVDTMIPKTEKIINKMILSKISDSGLHITYWISSVLSNVFLINLLIGGGLNLYIYSINSYIWKTKGIYPYNWFTNFILTIVLPTLIALVPYILIRIIAKLIKEKFKDEIDQSGLLFATGFFLIITHIEGVIRIIDSIVNILYRMQFNAGIDIVGFLNPFVSFIILIIYILIGLRYIKMSNYLKDKITEEQF